MSIKQRKSLLESYIRQHKLGITVTVHVVIGYMYREYVSNAQEKLLRVMEKCQNLSGKSWNVDTKKSERTQNEERLSWLTEIYHLKTKRQERVIPEGWKVQKTYLVRRKRGFGW